ncbi:response regulator [Candidatus Saccharibacteria bacterium]|nr:response regulator [Candidatus Saccharibacteria bacterium]
MGGYKRILVVEDDTTRQIVLKDIAQKIDVLGDCYLTDNLDDAKAYIVDHDDVDLVIMGWEFPTSIANRVVEKNGEELLRFVKNCQIKAVVCSMCATELAHDPDLSGTPLVMPVPFDSLEERIKQYL